jgi:hypothetical protein
VDLLRSVWDFLRGSIGFAVGTALSVFFTLVAVAQAVQEHPGISPWLFAFLAAVALLPGAFLAYHRMRKQRDAAIEERNEARSRPSGPVGFHLEGVGSRAWGNTSIVHQGPPAAVIEGQRRAGVLASLHREWVLSHDGITSAMLAGTEPLPKAWVEGRLKQLGESWQQPEYRPGQAQIPADTGSDGDD